jgi:hypothetical protein
MPTEFPLSPRTLNILRGRGLAKSGINPKEYNLVCSAPICLFETDHDGFGRDIEIIGYAICPKCKPQAKAIYPDDRISDDRARRSYWKCPVCGYIIPDSYAVWTQIVIAKHQGRGKKKRHIYYHKECRDAMYLGDTNEQAE